MANWAGLRTIVIIATLAVATGGCAFLTRSSVAGAPANTQADSASSAPSLSADGRFTAFLSPASNLVPGDTNGVVDVFVRDNFAQITTRVSTTSTGAQLTVPSADPSISDDGRYVAFVTSAPLVAADNLVAGDGDVYVKDRQTGAVTWASVRAGSLALVGDCLGDEISGNGAMVAFHCNELFPVGEGVFVMRPAGPWVRDLRFASTSGPYTSPSISGAVTDYDISGDGRVVVAAWEPAPLQSTAAQVAIGDTSFGQVTDAFDLAASGIAVSGDGSTYAVVTGDAVKVASTTSPTVFGAPLSGSSLADLALSNDGTLVGARTTSGGVQVAALRKSDGSDDWRIQSRTAGGDRIAAVTDATMSASGTWFAFTSPDPALVAGDTNGFNDVFTRSVFSIV